MADDRGPAYRAVRALWRALPIGVRQAIKPAAPEPTPPSPSPVAASAHEPDVRVIETLGELDEVMRQFEAAAAISDDELRKAFRKFRMQFPLELPADPDSDAYRARQLELYAWLHGKPYDVANEVSQLDPMVAADRPFPYLTGSAHTVGNQLIAIGNLIRHADVKPGSRVLEFGPGWGNTTLALARLGAAVTAIDVEANFIALIDEQARRHHVSIETIHGDFSAVDRLTRQFDVVLFFESFHHASKPQALIASLDRVVAPGGRVVFAGEPISPDFPMPWGLRLDGESLWAIRRHGWLELGFREDYFVTLLERHGWKVQKSACTELRGPVAGWGIIYTAERYSPIG